MHKIFLLSIFFIALFQCTLALNCSNLVLTSNDVIRNFNLDALTNQTYSISEGNGFPRVYNFSVCRNLDQPCVDDGSENVCSKNNSASVCEYVPKNEKDGKHLCFKDSGKMPVYTTFSLPGQKKPREGILFKNFFAEKGEQETIPFVDIYIVCNESISLDEKPTIEGPIHINENATHKDSVSVAIILSQKAGCPTRVHKIYKGTTLSTGSKMLIVFFTVVAAYLFLGIVLNYFSGASGLNLIPNFKFWSVTLPSLVVDGLSYIRGTYKPAYISVS